MGHEDFLDMSTRRKKKYNIGLVINPFGHVKYTKQASLAHELEVTRGYCCL